MRRDCFILFLMTLCLVLIDSSISNAQMNKNDSAFYQSAVSNAINIYHASSGDQNALLNGSLYYGYPFRFKQGNALFFPDSILKKGSVVYDNISYSDVSLEYDNLQDLVIVQDSLYWVQVDSKKVSEFNLSDHHFIRLEKDATNKDIVMSGFYEVLHEGPILILKKDVKRIHEEPSIVEGLERSVFKTSYYYVKRREIIYPVRSQDDIINIFQDKKKELRQFLRSNKLKFKKDKDNTLLQSVIYYEQLTRQI